jgi:hypothetical protein
MPVDCARPGPTYFGTSAGFITGLAVSATETYWSLFDNLFIADGLK